MANDDSVIRWIEGVRSQDAAACDALWRECFPELVRHARGRLRHLPRRVADEEDVALSAMDTFMRGIREGRFQELAGSDDLLQLLLWITSRKAADLVRRETSQKRGGGKVAGDSALAGGAGQAAPSPIRPPDLALAVAEEVGRLLAMLDDEGLQAIAVAKAEGWSNQEIAAQQQCSERTVERRLRLIRTIWSADC